MNANKYGLWYTVTPYRPCGGGAPPPAFHAFPRLSAPKDLLASPVGAPTPLENPNCSAAFQTVPNRSEPLNVFCALLCSFVAKHSAIRGSHSAIEESEAKRVYPKLSGAIRTLKYSWDGRQAPLAPENSLQRFVPRFPHPFTQHATRPRKLKPTKT